ncbi:MAG: SAM-dependent methyltransferase [Lentisphaeraceae bacterium]|nr:SAM-dependent methyltransferase [Lentisphaeraceae bacterium]
MQARGTLIMAANSLGLPEDIPQRSLQAVRDSDLLIFEEDKPARIVLKTAGVHRDYLKYNEQHQEYTLDAIKESLAKGHTVTYMSDQGCPTLEDPGYNIVRCAQQTGAKVKVIPGPSSLTAALSACPFREKLFEFLGFPPRLEDKRRAFLTKLKKKSKLQVLMDTPYRLAQVIETCDEVFSQESTGFIALDISGEDEEYLLGTFSELHEQVKKIDKKLNFVLIIYTPQTKSNSKPSGPRKPPQNNKRRNYRR